MILLLDFISLHGSTKRDCDRDLTVLGGAGSLAGPPLTVVYSFDCDPAR